MEEGVIRAGMMCISMLISIILSLLWLYLGIPLAGFFVMFVLAITQGTYLALAGQMIATDLINWMNK